MSIRSIQRRYGRPIGILLLFLLFLFSLGGLILLSGGPSDAEAAGIQIPKVTLSMDEEEDPAKVVDSLKLLFVLTLLMVAPSLLITMTPFSRIVIVFFFLRQALGTQQSPPNMVLIGLSLFLTYFIMRPVITEINEKAFQPYLDEELTQAEALDRAASPLKAFMLKQTREADLALFFSVSGLAKPQSPSDVPMHIAIPAFITSELKTAFQIGFLIYIPFLILDMVIASVLMAMGMMMLPPVVISLPFKIMLFIMVDGWNLLVGSLIKSFG